MSRKSNIKWRKSDEEKLNSLVNKFNNKIYRTRHTKKEVAKYQPNTIKTSDKKELIQNFKNMPRKEFKKYLNSLERYLKKGSENIVKGNAGLTTTKWEKKEVGLKIQQINAERTRKLKQKEQLEVTSRGVPTGMKRGEMGSARMNELKPKSYNFDKIRGGKEWEKFKNTVSKQSKYGYKEEKMDNYKENYLKGLENEFGEYGQEIADIVRQLPSEIMVEHYYKEQEAELSFIYDNKEMEIRLYVLKELWESVLNDYEDTIHG